MQVHKFGGASISDEKRIRNLPVIVKAVKGNKTVLVISAMGKMTNTLEDIATAYFRKERDKVNLLFDRFKQAHANLAHSLMRENDSQIQDRLQEFFAEGERIMQQPPKEEFNFYYDQIVCIGELCSSAIVSAWLRRCGIENCWIDVRSILRTDAHFREAGVIWNLTLEQVNQMLLPSLVKNDMVVLQGFIGSTEQLYSTTLGREGSDYSAALFAYLLDAEYVTIWKDVKGVLNADPREIADTLVMPEMSYREAVEMAYYGAQVIHPKTIKPLQNKGIALRVKSFIDPLLPGTIISNLEKDGLPPIIIYKRNQVLITFRTQDFAFMEGDPVHHLQSIFSQLLIKPNLTQNTAISLQVCIDENEQKINELLRLTSDEFDLSVEQNLTLLTIRHFDQETVDLYSRNHSIVLEQKTRNTIRLLMEKVPVS